MVVFVDDAAQTIDDDGQQKKQANEAGCLFDEAVGRLSKSAKVREQRANGRLLDN